jgi:Zn-dependent alcohol dehydrogenase
MRKARAIIFRPSAETESNWSTEDVLLREPRENELVIRIVATGICHTDLLRKPGSGGFSSSLWTPTVDHFLEQTIHAHY